MVAAWNIVKELYAFTICTVLCAVGVVVSYGVSCVIATSVSRV